MKYRYLGKSGLLVSRVSLGTMTFGAEPWGCDEKEAHRIVARYLEAGGNFIDTANNYAGGKTEEILGSCMKELKRTEFVLATKCYFPVGAKPNSQGSSRKHIIASCETSLRRLKTDYIDVFYLHGPDPLVPAEEVMETLDVLVRQGKILYPACSNLFGWQIAKAQETAKRYGRSGFICGQYLYNLIQRDVEAEVIPAMLDYGVGILAWSPLGGGLLTGKYAGMEKPPAGSRIEARIKVDGPRFWHEKGFAVVAKLKALAANTGLPMAKLAISWLLTKKFLSSVIIGVKSLEQLEQNLEVGDWDLPEDVAKKLDELSARDKDYLSWFNENNYRNFSKAAEFLCPGTGAIIEPK